MDSLDLAVLTAGLPVASETMQADTAHRLHLAALAYRVEAEAALLKLGMVLSVIRDYRLYRFLGHETFEDYIASPDIAYERTHTYRLMRVARDFAPLIAEGSVTEADVTEMGIAKADIARRVIMDGPDADVGEWVARAKTLTVPDLERAAKEQKHGPFDERAEFLDDIRRHLVALASKLGNAPDPAAVLDEVTDYTMQARAALEQFDSALATV